MTFEDDYSPDGDNHLIAIFDDKGSFSSVYDAKSQAAEKDRAGPF